MNTLFEPFCPTLSGIYFVAPEMDPGIVELAKSQILTR